jgi:pyruvate/2-oxoglutarate dehydrogenase complex dihydrolipoamide acyltransferase (E2) component
MGPSKAQTRKLSQAERWLNDCLLVSHQPAFHQSIEVDVSSVEALIKEVRDRDIRLTYTDVLVRTAALALARNPDLHRILAGNRVQNLAHVDIAVSVSEECNVVPTMIIESVDEKSLVDIASEVARRLPEVREQYRKLLALANAWGWLAPFGFIRRATLRLLFRSFSYRRRGLGTFQVSVVRGVDAFATPIFNTAAILTAGQVKHRPIALDGVPTVRATIVLTCSADHRLWNGQDCQRFLNTVRDVIMSGQLAKEVRNEATPPERAEDTVPSSDAPRSYR